MGFLGMRALDAGRKLIQEAIRRAAPMAFLAVLCLLFGVLPTYVIPALGPCCNPLAGASAADALVPPFFASNPAHGTLPPAFVAEFHNLGAQVGQSVLPGRGLVVLHRGGTENPVVFAMSTSYMLVGVDCLADSDLRHRPLVADAQPEIGAATRWDGGVRRCCRK